MVKPRQPNRPTTTQLHRTDEEPDESAADAPAVSRERLHQSGDGNDQHGPELRDTGVSPVAATGSAGAALDRSATTRGDLGQRKHIVNTNNRPVGPRLYELSENEVFEVLEQMGVIADDYSDPLDLVCEAYQTHMDVVGEMVTRDNVLDLEVKKVVSLRCPPIILYLRSMAISEEDIRQL